MVEQQQQQQPDLKQAITENLLKLKEKVDDSNVVLLAVSKTKPNESILACYEAGHRTFGENFVDEFVGKAEVLPKDIQWHFIGHLQSNKAKKLVSVENLHLLESVDSLKLAQKLEKECQKINREQLNIFLQVQTSDEGTKFGIEPDQIIEVINTIKDECKSVKVKGLMNMGKLHDEEGFKLMNELKKKVEQECQIEPCLLSMGTSADYELALKHGATEVRLGTTIFGAREYPNKQAKAAPESPQIDGPAQQQSK